LCRRNRLFDRRDRERHRSDRPSRRHLHLLLLHQEQELNQGPDRGPRPVRGLLPHVLDPLNGEVRTVLHQTLHLLRLGRQLLLRTDASAPLQGVPEKQNVPHAQIRHPVRDGHQIRPTLQI
jgi:hypothetical protein